MSFWTVVFGLAFLVMLIVVKAKSGNNRDLESKLQKTRGRLDHYIAKYETASRTILKMERQENMNTDVARACNTLSEDISQYLEDLGIKELDIQNPDEPFSELGSEAREQLSMILGPIFQEGAADATSQRWDGILKLAEIRYRLTLYKEQELSGHAQMGIDAKVHHANLQLALDLVKDQKALIESMGFDHLDIDNDRYGELLLKTQMYNFYVKVLKVMGLQDTKLMEGVKELLPRTSTHSEIPKNEKVEEEADYIDGEFVEGDFSENGKGSLKRTGEKEHD